MKTPRRASAGTESTYISGKAVEYKRAYYARLKAAMHPAGPFFSLLEYVRLCFNDFKRVGDLNATLAEHDRGAAVFIRRELNGALHLFLFESVA